MTPIDPRSTDSFSDDYSKAHASPEWIHSVLVPNVNLAYCHNAVPWIETIQIVNPTDSKISHADLTLRAEPPFVSVRTWRIDGVEGPRKI